jgi:Ca2+-binding EF-hand superfamily protein
MIGSIGSTSSLLGQLDFSALRQQREAKMFQEMDADGSGSVSKDEFSSWDKKMREQMPQTGDAGSMPSAEDIFAQLDTDENGSLSQSELSKMGEKMKEIREAQMFKAADADGNGTISKDEFASWQDQVQARRSQITGAGNMPSADDIFSQADSDGDGSISKAEFSDMGKKMGGPPPGPPPGGGGSGGVGGAGGSGSTIQTLMDALSQNSESSESTGSTDPLDTNGDGKVSLQELIAGMKSYTNTLEQSLQTEQSSSLNRVA